MTVDYTQFELPTDYQKFIHLSRYAREVEGENRRETWGETVRRYTQYITKDVPDMEEEIARAIGTLEVMPSMRALWTAGPALSRCNSVGYNCAYLPILDVFAFSEVMYLLMGGSGVGFSVERQYISRLPSVPLQRSSNRFVEFEDSREGWARGFDDLLSALYAGEVPRLDFSNVRPAGTKLKTMGGRSSGPEPLKRLCEYTQWLFKKASYDGRRLQSLEVHDLVCMIADIVVVGGVRRSALISLSNLSDDRMRQAKMGQWYLPENNPQRALANNSYCATERPYVEVFMREWLSLVESRSGERGIFNRQACEKLLPERRKRGYDWGCNPCSEIVLRPFGFCNLTEIVVRPDDDAEALMYKAGIASLLGTLQSRLTNFQYLRPEWRQNAEEERLLGVSLTGIMENELTAKPDPELLVALRREVELENRYWATHLGINLATATTCVKPSGTVAELVNCSPGIHARFAPHYVRTVRQDRKDPLTQLMIDQGVPHEPSATTPDHQVVFSFPMAAPGRRAYAGSESAIDQLERWLAYQLYYCEHKPSCTVYVQHHEWPEVGAWVWKHFDKVSGISFLPYSDHVYEQAPFQPITVEQYKMELEKRKGVAVDWSQLTRYESEVNTRGGQELACTAGGCEI